MATKTKVNNMSNEEEKKVAEWIQESKGGRFLSEEKMAERYSVALSMFGDGQREPLNKEQPKEDEVSAATDLSVATPPSEVTEPTSMESTQQNQQPLVHRVKQAAQTLFRGIPLCLSSCSQDREPYARVHQCLPPRRTG